jgi:uncharacterized protein (DUF1697 family)
MTVAAGADACSRTVLLLRGINVGGRHPLPMAALRALLLEAFSCREVQTYIQSGNVVCTTPVDVAQGSLSAALEKRFGFPVPVVLRTAAEWHALIAANPFLQASESSDALHLVLLHEPLPGGLLAKLQQTCTGEERMLAHGRELYLSLPHGAGRSKLALAVAGPKMPPQATMRNWRTVRQLQSML